MKTNIKILFLIKNLNLTGGVESYVKDFSCFLKKEGFYVEFLGLPKFFFKFKNNFVSEVLGSFYFYFKIKMKYRNYIVIGNGFGMEFLKNNYVIIHGTWPGFLLKNKQNNFFWKVKYYLRLIQLKYNLKHNKIISVKPSCDFNRKYDYFIPPFFEFDNKLKNINNKKVYDFIMIGRGDKNKRINEIIDIINSSKNLSELSFIFIGTNYPKLKIKSNNIKIYSYLEREEIYKILQKTKYLMIFSNYEGFPVVLKEAFINNVKVIMNKSLYQTIFGNIKIHNDSDFIVINDFDDKTLEKDILKISKLNYDHVKHKFLQSIFLKSDINNFIKELKNKKEEV